MNIFTLMGPTPSRVLGLFRLLLARGGEAPEAELAEFFHPAPLRSKDSKFAEETLAAATELGLTERVQKTSRQMIRVAAGITAHERDSNCLHETFPRLAARLALRPEIGDKPNRFARACAWFLMQPVGGIPEGHGPLKTGLLQAKAKPDWDLGLDTDNRVDMLVYWAKHIGLLAQLREKQCHGLAADPTDYLRRHLSDLLPKTTAVPIRAFRERLGKLCPVLDGGDVRHDALQAFEVEWPEDRLSDALAFALRRLETEGRILLEYANDARGDSFLRLGADQKATRVSRVNAKGESA